MGCGGGRTRGLGELGRDVGAALRPFEGTIRPTEVDEPPGEEREGAELRRVGVDGRELERAIVELEFVEICGLELGVDGLELWDGRGRSIEELVRVWRGFEGVEGRDTDGRPDGVEGLAVEGERLIGEDGLAVEGERLIGEDGLAVEGERLIGEDGLIYEETEAELVFSIEGPPLFDE